jgi:hypothetical protein
MIKYILCFLLLTGCTTVAPIKHEFPKPPEVITEKCSNLLKVPEDEQKLTEFLKIVIKNYGMYYECAEKHESLIEWINQQGQIYNDVFNKR